MHYPSFDQRALFLALESVGVSPGATLSVQASLSRVGLYESAPSSQGYHALKDALLDFVGSRGSLVIPSYTYSLGRGEVFDPDTTASAIGPFSQTPMHDARFERSLDPMLANSVAGPLSRFLIDDLPYDCYGPGSLFDRLFGLDAIICTIGVASHYAPFRHYVEQSAQVPFRFLKTFLGHIKTRRGIEHQSWRYFAAPLGVQNCEPDARHLGKLAEAAGIVLSSPLGRGRLYAFSAKKFTVFALELMRQDPWISAKGPPIPIRTFVERELC